MAIANDSTNATAANVETPRPLPKLLRWYAIAMLCLGLLALAATVLLRHHNPFEYPYNNPLFQNFSFQFDFECFRPRFVHFHQAAFFSDMPHVPEFNYPAPMAMIYEMLYNILPRGHVLFIAACGLLYVAAAALFARALVRRGVILREAVAFSALALLVSEPVALQLFLANMEFVVWLAVALGTWAWFRGHYWAAAACFGLAASLKIYPVVFLSLMLSQKRYREIAFGVLTWIATSVVSLWALGPTIPYAYRGIQQALVWFQTYYLFHFNRPESGIDHSVFALLRLIAHHEQRLDLLPQILHVLLLVEAIGGGAVYLLVLRKLPLLNQLMALTIAGVLLTPLSHDYTLLHMYAPFALLVLWLLRSPLHSKRRRLAAIALGCFAVLFAVEPYIIHSGLRMEGQVKCIALMALLLFSLCVPLELPIPADAPLCEGM